MSIHPYRTHADTYFNQRTTFWKDSDETSNEGPDEGSDEATDTGDATDAGDVFDADTGDDPMVLER